VKSIACGLLMTLVASAAHADVIAATRHGLLVSTGERVALVRDGERQWSRQAAVREGTFAVGADRAALLDPLRNEAIVFDLARGTSTMVATAETPVAAAFAGDDLIVLARDARTVERITPDGRRRAVPTGADPAFLRMTEGSLVVYSRGDGRLQRIDPSSMRVIVEAVVAPFASDLEIDRGTVYLTYPREALIRQFDLKQMKPAGSLTIGAVPVDLALGVEGNAISARRLAVADPAARRLWTIEGRQSVAQAFARGFVRGLIGLGLFRSTDSTFPTGVDRVLPAGKRWVAYDSAQGKLYLVSGKSVKLIATGVGPGAFTTTVDSVAWVADGAVRTSRF
jgi:hypothetical protein